MSRLRCVFLRLRRHPAPQPWMYERLATPDERARLLGKTDLEKAA